MSTILLVDDDVDLSELIRTKLLSEGHQVEVYHSGQGAFELAKRVKPDIAILDIMLPEVTGYQICRRIRKDPELYRMAILILTALGEEPEIMHGLEQGADDYLSKPFKLEALTEKLTSLAGLMESLQRRHSLTGLPGTDAIKREINHRLARGMAIAACYIDMVGFKPYYAVYGPEGQRRVMSFMGRLLTQLTRNIGVYECFIAHMGGEHFVILLNLEDYERFCNALTQTFDSSMKELYSSTENQQGYIVAVDKYGREGHYPLMALAIGVAHTQFRHYKSAKKMFEVLAQTRQKAQPEGKSAVFVDRRRTDR
jgi:CheY-like chemotaxis protein